MNLIKLIFTKTHHFWIILRIVLIFVFTASLVRDLVFVDIQFSFSTIRSFAHYFAFEVNVICMIILSIAYFLKRQTYFWIQLYVGFYSIYFSVITAKGLYDEFGDDKIYILVLPLFLFFYGIWEMYFNKKSSNKK